MKARTIPIGDLTDQQEAGWVQIARTDPLLFSPFLHPQFARAVGRVRDDIEVLVVGDPERPVGFLPFQRRARVAAPVAAGMNEFQALIAPTDEDIDLSRCLRQCGLSVWHFDHLVTHNPAWHLCLTRVGESAYVDLSEGFEAYQRQRRAAGSHVFASTSRKLRKLQRDVGPIRFEFHDPRDEVFRQLIAWKAQQHQRTGVLDTFQWDWVRDVMRQVSLLQGSDMRGILSALWCEQRLLAVQLGMQAGQAAHLWFPTYNPDFARYSPGMILIVELLKSLEQHGIRRLDLGPGDQRYKQSLMNASLPVAIGTLDTVATIRCLRRSWSGCRNLLRRSSLAQSLRRPAQWWFRRRQRRTFKPREGGVSC